MFQAVKKVRLKSTGAVMTVEVWSYQGEIRYLFHNNWFNPSVFEEV